jgi:hypothetical protein
VTLIEQPPARPSAAHELRVVDLTTMAVLAGFDVAVDVLPDGSRPDVLRASTTRRTVVFLGDAKSSETPGNLDTAQRLRRYMLFASAYVTSGGSVVLALAVPDVPGTTGMWRRLLADVTARCASPPGLVRAVTISVGFSVVLWTVLERPGDRLLSLRMS